MSNYPPGTSAGDPRAPWNAPDTSHDHEWEADQDMFPLFEDMAAIFHEYCRHVTPTSTAKGYEGEIIVEAGIECEEERTWRFEMVEIQLPNGDTFDPQDDDEWDDHQRFMENAVMKMGGRTPQDDDVVVKEFDHDRRSGRIVVQHAALRYTYEPVVE